MKWLWFSLAAIVAVVLAIFLTMKLLAMKAAKAATKEADLRTDPAGTDQVGVRRPGPAKGSGVPQLKLGLSGAVKRASNTAVENLVNDAEKSFADKLAEDAARYIA